MTHQISQEILEMEIKTIYFSSATPHNTHITNKTMTRIQELWKEVEARPMIQEDYPLNLQTINKDILLNPPILRIGTLLSLQTMIQMTIMLMRRLCLCVLIIMTDRHVPPRVNQI
jgi:hypothetical protein